MTDLIENSLANIPLFSCLPAEERSRLAQNLAYVDLAVGEVLFREGDESDEFYIVLSGQLEIVKALGTPEASVEGISGTGEFLGEMGLLNQNGLRTASVRAISGSRLLKVPTDRFKALLSQQPIFSCHLASVLSARLTSSRDRTIERLSEANRQLQQAYESLQAAQDELLEKKALEHELILARDIQRSILPTRFPPLPGYDFDALMIPARVVGGDFFGLFPLDEEHMAMVIGDVMGKGVPAGIFMAQTYALLRATAHTGLSPAETLLRVNRLLLKMSDSELFVTLVYGVLNASTGIWRYARAGHELPILASAAGDVRPVPMTEGMPLGILDDPVLEEGCLRVRPGELLLLYTDGVTDGVDCAGEHFDHARLESVLRAMAGQDAETVCQSVLKALRQFQHDEAQSDDITLVAIRRNTSTGLDEAEC